MNKTKKRNISSPVKKRLSPPKKRIVSLTEQMKDKLHVVLDLDATLLESVFIDESLGLTKNVINDRIKYFEDKIINNKKLALSKREDFKKRFHKIYLEGNDEFEGYTILRPHIFEFLDFCNDFFKEVSVWTAGNKIYADTIVNILFQFHKPEIVFSRDECIMSCESINAFLKNEELLFHFNKEETKTKNSEKVKKSPSPSYLGVYTDDDSDGNGADRECDYSLSKPLIRVCYKSLIAKNKSEDLKKKNIKQQSEFLKDIILIDDRDDTSHFNKNNLVVIQPFSIEKITQKELLKSDSGLLEMIEFFKKIPLTEDIREYLKKR